MGAEEPSLRALLDTGTSAWEVLRLEGYRFTAPLAAFRAGAAQDLDAARFTWDFAEGGGTGWEALLRGAAPLTIPSHTRRRAIIDLDDYL